MTPQELEALLQKAHAQNYDKYRDQRVEHFVGPTLCKLAPALLDLWQSSEDAEQADKAVKMARYASAASYAPLLKRLQEARAARRAALARLRDVRL